MKHMPSFLKLTLRLFQYNPVVSYNNFIAQFTNHLTIETIEIQIKLKSIIIHKYKLFQHFLSLGTGTFSYKY